MLGQLTRFGIDPNCPFLSIAWGLEGRYSQNWKLQFFSSMTVLLGGSSVKKLTELNDFQEILLEIGFIEEMRTT